MTKELDLERLATDREYWDAEIGPEWEIYHYTQDDPILRTRKTGSITRPQPTWRGPEDGLPPVGTECEFRSKGGSMNSGFYLDWIRCNVLAITKSYVILRHITDYTGPDHECSHHLSRIEFRPLRSPEDLAVEAMETSWDKSVACVREEVCRAIYHAIRDGKIPGVRLDDLANPDE